MISSRRADIWKRVVWTIEIVATILFVLPYILTAFHGNIAQDDFSNVNWLRRYSELGYIQQILSYAKSVYFSWQGTYFGSALIAFGVGLFLKFGNIAFQIEFAIVIIGYFAAFFVLTNKIFKELSYEGFNKNIAVITTYLSFLILLFFNTHEIKDVFYWHTGLAVYTVPLLVVIVYLIFCIGEQVSVFRYCILALLAFLAAGGALDISALICELTLLFAAVRTIKGNTWFQSALPFGAAFLGAIINVLAPGNYVRYKGTPGLENVLTALLKASKEVIGCNEKLLTSRGIVFVMIAAAVVLLCNQNSINFLNPIILIVASFVCEVIVDFPVFLGSGGLQERGKFVGKNVAVVFLLFIVIDTLGYLSWKLDVEFTLNKEIIAILAAFTLAMVLTLFSKEVKTNCFPFVIYSDLFDGTLTRYENANDIVLKTLDESKEDDVLVIEINDYPRLDYIKGMGVNEDPENWVNVYIRDMYGIKSLSVLYGEENQ